jgi:hypothetical protein
LLSRSDRRSLTTDFETLRRRAASLIEPLSTTATNAVIPSTLSTSSLVSYMRHRPYLDAVVDAPGILPRSPLFEMGAMDFDVRSAAT